MLWFLEIIDNLVWVIFEMEDPSVFGRLRESANLMLPRGKFRRRSFTAEYQTIKLHEVKKVKVIWPKPFYTARLWDQRMRLFVSRMMNLNFGRRFLRDITVAAVSSAKRFSATKVKHY